MAAGARSRRSRPAAGGTKVDAARARSTVGAGFGRRLSARRARVRIDTGGGRGSWRTAAVSYSFRASARGEGAAGQAHDRWWQRGSPRCAVSVPGHWLRPASGGGERAVAADLIATRTGQLALAARRQRLRPRQPDRAAWRPEAGLRSRSRYLADAIARRRLRPRPPGREPKGPEAVVAARGAEPRGGEVTGTGSRRVHDARRAQRGGRGLRPAPPRRADGAALTGARARPVPAPDRDDRERRW